MISRGRLPSNELERRELIDLFGCLLEAGHTIEESMLFLLQVTDEDADSEMRIDTEAVS